MTDIEIKKIVNYTVNELLKEKMFKYNDLIVYEQIGERLRQHYRECDVIIQKAIDQLTDDRYIDVLEFYYKNEYTLEYIAEIFDVDVSTIVRNKKNLCLKIFELIN